MHHSPARRTLPEELVQHGLATSWKLRPVTSCKVVQRRIAVIVLHIDIRTPLQQHLNDLIFAMSTTAANLPRMMLVGYLPRIASVDSMATQRLTQRGTV